MSLPVGTKENMLTKKEAAEYLNVSTRAIERYTSSGKLPCTHITGRYGKETRYSQQELDRFRQELDAPSYQPEIIHPTTTYDTNLTPDTGSLSRVSEGEVGGESINDYEERFLVALSNLANRTSARDKLLLSLQEAQQLTGLSRAFLVESIKQEELKAQKLGRGWKIKRRDLDTYIDNLWFLTLLFWGS